jgi:hypothetical protein
MKLLPVVLALGIGTTLLTGCTSDPVGTNATNNKNFTVDLLFENDGCRVYRFADGGQLVYYANCGARTQTSWDRSCGKGCTTRENVSTWEGQ